VSHLLRSRFEVESTITWLELKGQWARPAGTSLASVQAHRARVAVAQARSVFYAAAPHRLGSRTLRGLSGDDAAAWGWLQTLQQLSESVAMSRIDSDEPRRGLERTPVRTLAQDAAPAPWALGAGRRCAVCSADIPMAARYCPSCGSAVPQV
jgi:hypothetical protein